MTITTTTTMSQLYASGLVCVCECERERECVCVCVCACTDVAGWHPLPNFCHAVVRLVLLDNNKDRISVLNVRQTITDPF
jgi:hypothetical protein